MQISMVLESEKVTVVLTGKRVMGQFCVAFFPAAPTRISTSRIERRIWVFACIRDAQTRLTNAFYSEGHARDGGRIEGSRLDSQGIAGIGLTEYYSGRVPVPAFCYLRDVEHNGIVVDYQTDIDPLWCRARGKRDVRPHAILVRNHLSPRLAGGVVV